MRVVASTSFVDGPDGVMADGEDLRPPYEFVAIGDSATMKSALDIPGGVLETLRSGGAEGVVDPGDTLTVVRLAAGRGASVRSPGPGPQPLSDLAPRGRGPPDPGSGRVGPS